MTQPDMTQPIVALARFTIEAISPLSIGAGSGATRDLAIARDANGLPMIPGRSLRGVLRHLWPLLFRTETARLDALLGKEGPEHKDGHAGLITFGQGCVHDSSGIAVTGLRLEAPAFDCRLLRRLVSETPLLREHVALDHRHVTDDRKKFDRTAVPAGARFSFELSMRVPDGEPGVREASEAFERIHALMDHALFRLGGGSRRGYGRIRVLMATMTTFDARQDAERLRDTREKAPSESCDEKILIAGIDSELETELARWGIAVKPIGFLRTGSTGTPDRDAEIDALNKRFDKLPEARRRTERDRDPLLVQVREPRITWQEDGTIDPGAAVEKLEYVIAGSGIRGALAHRTLFHYNRLCGRWASSDTEQMAAYAARDEALQTLLGWASDKDPDTGAASPLIVEDAVIEGAVPVVLDHNSIDRFTGGVRDGALYAEEVLYGGRFMISASLLVSEGAGTGKDEPVRKAFEMAMADLCNGRLALGAKSLGYLETIEQGLEEA